MIVGDVPVFRRLDSYCSHDTICASDENLQDAIA